MWRRPLAEEANASSKQRIGTHKNYLTPRIFEREIFYGTLYGRHVERAKSHFGHVTSYELTHFKKMVPV